MDSYKGFAYAYDSFMDDVPYDEWGENLRRLLCRYEIEKGSITELGCGTGRISRILSDYGYSVIGIDLSDEMLSIAMNNNDCGIIYSNQDMRNFDTGELQDSVISVCDSINYLLDEEDLLSCFKSVADNLKDDGVFIFDMKTRDCYLTMGNDTYTDSRDEGLLIWANEYDEDKCLNYYDIELFWKEEEDNKYERFFEQHTQRAYSVDEVRENLNKAGFDLLEVLDSDTMSDPVYNDYDSPLRLYFIAKKQSN